MEAALHCTHTTQLQCLDGYTDKQSTIKVFVTFEAQTYKRTTPQTILPIRTTHTGWIL